MMTESMESQRVEDGTMDRDEAEKMLESLNKQEVLMVLSFIAGIIHKPALEGK